MIPVISAQRMIELEKEFLNLGGDTEKLMDEVAKGSATFIANLKVSSCLIVAGSGNNGADALLTGAYLIQKGIPCTAYCTGPSKEQSLNAKQKSRFIASGGTIIETLPKSNPYSCCIDGILGIGFSGQVSDTIQKAIFWINSQKTPVISIDIPSGLDATIGSALCTVKATYTLTCHLPKLGLFINDGWMHTGQLTTIPLSLPTPTSTIFLLSHEDIAQRLPVMERTRNKYSAGAVIGVAGSLEMPGASLLAAEASLKVGAGIVRLFTPKEACSEPTPLEVIRIPIEEETPEKWKVIFDKADSGFIGPGLGRSVDAKRIFTQYLHLLPQKRVIDGDGLSFASTQPDSIKNALLTPHFGEMSTLLGHKITLLTQDILEEVRTYVKAHLCTLILKGAPTFIFSEDGTLYIMPKGDPALAKAGTGDVLTGMLAGLLAQKLSPLDAAIVGTWLHGRAGEIAAKLLTSYSVLASDLFTTIPTAISEQIGQNDTSCFTAGQ